jgi:hypothetical protein
MADLQPRAQPRLTFRLVVGGKRGEEDVNIPGSLENGGARAADLWVLVPVGLPPVPPLLRGYTLVPPGS